MMKLPTQAQPVMRSTSPAHAVANVMPSGIECTLCCGACNIVPWPASIACKLACRAISGCSC
jgi:hypothetical protein